MSTVTCSKFSVGGQAWIPLMPPNRGTWFLPCDGKSSVDIECSVKCTLGKNETSVKVPIWVGDYSIWPFGSTDFIDDEMVFNGQPGQKIELTFTYKVVCNTSCRLTASVVSGGAATRLHPLIGALCLTFAYEDPNDSRWYHTSYPICIACDRTRIVKAWKKDPPRLAKLDTGEIRNLLGESEKKGYLKLTKKGKDYLASNVFIRPAFQGKKGQNLRR